MSRKKLQMKKWMFLLIFGYFYINGFSQSLKDADIAFKQENYSKAINIWSKILEKKQGNPSQLYNNIGIAYSKEKEMGKAVLYFEKAIKENFNNEKAQRNLKITRAKLNLSNENNQLFFVIWWRSLIDLFSIFTWQIIFLIGIGTGSICYILLKKGKNTLIQKTLFLIFFLEVLIIVIFTSKMSILNSKNNAIICKSELYKYKDMSLTQPIGQLNLGEKVGILEELEAQLMVKNESDSTFWVKKNGAETI